MFLMKYASPLGSLTLAEENGKIIGLWMEHQKYFPMLSGTQQETPALRQAADWLDRYFAGQCPSPAELPLAPKGSDFRQAVWQILLQIPYGKTTTYGAIAAALARQRGIHTMSAQAVGGAVGHNPISVIIPCHRVLGADGSLIGYAGGTERKQWLLDFEQQMKNCPGD